MYANSTLNIFEYIGLFCWIGIVNHLWLLTSYPYNKQTPLRRLLEKPINIHSHDNPKTSHSFFAYHEIIGSLLLRVADFSFRLYGGFFT